MTRTFKLFTLIIAVFLMTGCTSANKPNENQNISNSTQTQKPAATKSNPINVDTEIQAPQREDGVLSLSLGFSTSLSDPRGIASEQFKQEVEEKTGGTIQITLYPDSQKGNDNDLITSVTSGNLDMTVSSAGNFTGYVNEAGISALPFLFEDFDDAWEFMDSPIITDINQKFEEFNIHVLAHFDNGFRCVTTKNQAINSPSDMVDLNIRTPDNAVVKETMLALGAKPQTLGFSELYTALEQGQFDAQENPIPIIYNNQFYKVQHYLAITNHSYDAMPFVISQASWEALTDQEQQILQTAATNAQTTNRNLIKQQTEDYKAKLEAEGMIITHPDLAMFKEKTSSVKTFFHYDEELLASLPSTTQ